MVKILNRYRDNQRNGQYNDWYVIGKTLLGYHCLLIANDMHKSPSQPLASGNFTVDTILEWENLNV